MPRPAASKSAAGSKRPAPNRPAPWRPSHVADWPPCAVAPLYGHAEPADDRELPYGGFTRVRLYFSTAGRGGALLFTALSGQLVGFDYHDLEALSAEWCAALSFYLRDGAGSLGSDQRPFRLVQGW